MPEAQICDAKVEPVCPTQQRGASGETEASGGEHGRHCPCCSQTDSQADPKYHVTFGCLSSLFCTKRLRRALTAGRKNTVAWIVDSGANIVVVPTADPAIVRLLPSMSQLRTAHGVVQVQHAVIRTPVGDCKGVVSAGSPRLMPDDVLKQKGWDYRRYGKHVFLVSSSDSSRRVRIQREGGCPIITNESLFQPGVKESGGGTASAILDQGSIAGGAAIEGSAGCGLRYQACVGVPTPPEGRENPGPRILGLRNSNAESVAVPARTKPRNRRSIASRIAHDRIHGTRKFRGEAQADKENQRDEVVQANPAADRPRRAVRAPARFRDGDAGDPAVARDASPPQGGPVIDLDELSESESGSDTDLFDPDPEIVDGGPAPMGAAPREPHDVETIPRRRKSAQKHRMPQQEAHERAGHRGMPDAVLHCPACEQCKVVVADARPARNPIDMTSATTPVRIVIDYEGSKLSPGMDGGQYSLVVRLYERTGFDQVRTATYGMACRSRQKAECIRKLHEFRTVMHLVNGSRSVRWMLHGDNEGAWSSHDMSIYLRAENGELNTSVAYAAHSKTAHEAAVRIVKETRNAGLFASGAPEKLWPDAQETTLLLGLCHARADFTPGANLAVAELKIPFGSLGVAHLHQDVLNDPMKRGTVVCFLRYRLDQVYGGRVMFYDRFKKKYRRTNISLSDVTWHAAGSYGWVRDHAGASHSQFGPDDEDGVPVPIEGDVSGLLDVGEMLIECQRCGKWRWWTEAIKRRYRAMRGVDLPEDFFCEMIPRITCDTPQPLIDQNEQWIEDDTHALASQKASAMLRNLEDLSEPNPASNGDLAEHFNLAGEDSETSEKGDDEVPGLTWDLPAAAGPSVESVDVPGRGVSQSKGSERRGSRSPGRQRRKRGAEKAKVRAKAIAVPLTDARHYLLRKMLARQPVTRKRAWLEHAHECERCHKTFVHNHSYGHTHRHMVCVPCKGEKSAWHAARFKGFNFRNDQPVLRACAARPIRVDKKGYHDLFDKLGRALKEAVLEDNAWLDEFRKTESSCMDDDELRDMDDDVLLARHATLFCANVARPLKKEEKSHPMAAEARASELLKIFVNNNTFTKPRTSAQARALSGAERDTVGRVAMIEVMKHAERQLSDTQNPPKFKARLVFLGNRIWRLQDREHVEPTGADVGLYGCVTTLESFRSVVAYAGANGYEAETTDLTAAYLQAPWPTEKAGRCYAKFTEKDLKEAPESIRKLAAATALAEGVGIDDLLWEMQRCLYGHPISGHAWITHFTSFLTRKGWSECHTPGLFRFQSLLLCVYVDDLCVAGSKLDLKDFWGSLDFVHDGEEPLSAYLGVRVHSEMVNGERIIRFDMRDYCSQIDEAFVKLFDEKRTDGKGRVYSTQARSRIPCASEEDIPMAEQSVPQRRVQKLLGMLLWLHRCSRPDIGCALSKLGSRVTTWNEECSAALARLVSYLRTTRTSDLHFRFVKGDKVRFVSHSDASLISPKSQSGACSFLVGGTSFALIAWGSSKQKVAADSSAWAEIVAVHSLVRSTMGLYLDWDRLLAGPPGVSDGRETWEVFEPMTILIDNSTALKIVSEGFSSTMIAAHVMLRLRRDLLRDAWQQGLINVGHVRTDANIADGFTKYLSKEKLDVFRVQCGLVPSQKLMLTNFDRITGADTTRLDAEPEDAGGIPEGTPASKGVAVPPAMRSGESHARGA